MINPETFQICAKKALYASSRYIRDAILGNIDLNDALVKEDKTAITIVDLKSQRLALPIIQRYFPNASLNPEEGPVSGDETAQVRIYFDPLDGTGGFLIGAPTPTVILAAYDRITKKVLACATMEPITGKLFISTEGKGAYLERIDYNTGEWTGKRRLQVNNAQFGQRLQPHVLVDVTHPFRRNGGKREILTKNGRRILTDRIEYLGGKEASFYTNGGHYALVALGNPTVIGNITTAIGGPFDIAGIRHVLEAGGAAECYQIKPAREGIEAIQENIEDADLVIAANNRENLLRLEEIVRRSVTQE